MNALIRTGLSIGLLLFTTSATHANAAEPTLRLTDTVGIEKAFSRDTLEQTFGKSVMTVENNPAYGATPVSKSYRGVSFTTVLKRMLRLSDDVSFAEFRKELDKYVIEITCVDGYKPVLQSSLFIEGREPFLADQEIEFRNAGLFGPKGLGRWFFNEVSWSPIAERGQNVNPGPFYLVWNTAEAYPAGWPYQIASIRFVKAEAYRSSRLSKPNATRPVDIETFETGYRTFTENCVACHAISGIGGDRGPDLGVIAPSLTDASLKAWIKIMENTVIHKTLSETEKVGLTAYLRNLQNSSK